MEEFYREVMHVHNKVFIERLCEISTLVELKKDGVLLSVGEVPSRLCLLESGGLRGYYLDEKEHEITECFRSAPGDALMPDFDLKKPSHLTIAAYKYSRIVCMSLPECLRVIRSHREGLTCYAKLVQQAAVYHQQMKIQLYKPAAERYEWFVRTYPTEAAEVSGKCVASFLGITPVTLSRIRRQRKAEESNVPPSAEDS